MVKRTLPGSRIILLAALAIVSTLSVILLAVPSLHNSSVQVEGTVFFQPPSGPVALNVEIADTPQEQTQGLMHREQLNPDDGMLFVFTDDSPRSFWMKNTLIPLDMIFVNSSLDIIAIHENVPPCVTLSCPTYRSGPARYVVEAVGGFSALHGIETGQRIAISIQ